MYTNTLTSPAATGLLMMSSIKIKKRREPSGIPSVTRLEVDNDILTGVCWILPNK